VDGSTVWTPLLYDASQGTVNLDTLCCLQAELQTEVPSAEPVRSSGAISHRFNLRSSEWLLENRPALTNPRSSMCKPFGVFGERSSETCSYLHISDKSVTRPLSGRSAIRNAPELARSLTTHPVSLRESAA
jgi:hypothetical protein